MAEARWPILICWDEPDRGGHVAAFEQPTLFADEMRKAFRPLRWGPGAAGRRSLPFRSGGQTAPGKRVLEFDQIIGH